MGAFLHQGRSRGIPWLGGALIGLAIWWGLPLTGVREAFDSGAYWPTTLAASIACAIAWPHFGWRAGVAVVGAQIALFLGGVARDARGDAGGASLWPLGLMLLLAFLLANVAAAWLASAASRVLARQP